MVQHRQSSTWKKKNYSLQLDSPRAAAPSIPFTSYLAIGRQDRAARTEFLFQKNGLLICFLCFPHCIVHFICAGGGTRAGSLDSTGSAVNIQGQLCHSPEPPSMLQNATSLIVAFLRIIGTLARLPQYFWLILHGRECKKDKERRCFCLVVVFCLRKGQRFRTVNNLEEKQKQNPQRLRVDKQQTTTTVRI